MEKELMKVIQFILNEYNIDLSVFEDSHIQKVLSDWLSKLKCESAEELIETMKQDAELIVKIYESFRNGYSLFFRDSILFYTFQQKVLDIYASGKREGPVRIWDIGCSKGQEPYSIAIILEELKRKYQIQFDYHIFATDISSTYLEMAKQGIYRTSDVKNVTLHHLETYFDNVKDKYRIKDEIKKHIDFSIHDIVLNSNEYPKESIYGSFDFIFICNVLIYYQPDLQKDIIEDLLNHINKDGKIVTSRSEITQFKRVGALKQLVCLAPILGNEV